MTGAGVTSDASSKTPVDLILTTHGYFLSTILATTSNPVFTRASNWYSFVVPTSHRFTQLVY